VRAHVVCGGITHVVRRLLMEIDAQNRNFAAINHSAQEDQISPS
jgi:hypothetical protein